MTEYIIGIDLGTTNSEVAIVEQGKVTVIGEQKMLPSYVGLDEQAGLLVGEAARNQYVLYPERTIKSIKRKMGSEETVNLGEQAYSPQEISAMLLKHLKGVAEQYLKKPVHKAVITVPAYFNDTQRQATREAGEIAGLEVVRMINEPTAAALAYEADHQEAKNILVYDLGGGTFDVSVVHIQDDIVEVVSSHGNNHLGGDDFDQCIAEHILDFLKEQHQIDPSQQPQAMARILRAAQEVKHALSTKPYASIEEEYLLQTEGEAPFHLKMEVSRDDYEEMIGPFIDETIEAIHTALKGAKLSVANIDEVLLVGGSTRTPLVQRRLEEDFGQQPRGEVNPDLCVAMGASIQANMIAGGNALAVLVDVTPYTFGTSALGEIGGMPTVDKYIPIIRKNTPIPTVKSDVFYTMHDNQREVKVDVYQGEDEYASKNASLGEFMVTHLSKVPEGNPIVIDFALDLNGVLKVTAVEKCTGAEKAITIDNAISRFEEEEMERAKNRVNSFFDTALEETSEGQEEKEPQTQTQAHAVEVQAQALVEKAERMLDEASAEDREDIVNLMEQIKEGLSNKDFTGINAPVEELADILYYLED